MSNKIKIMKCRDINGRESEVPINKFKFRPSVYGILIEDDKILLSRQWDGYDFPGGGIDIDETIEEALKREFVEETGIQVESIMPVHTETDFFNPNYADKYKGQYWNCITIYYLVKKVGGELSKDNLCDTEQEYADMPEWIDINKTENLKFFNPIDSASVIKKANSLL